MAEMIEIKTRIGQFDNKSCLYLKDEVRSAYLSTINTFEHHNWQPAYKNELFITNIKTMHSIYISNDGTIHLF